jgi:hypothetical protein
MKTARILASDGREIAIGEMATGMWSRFWGLMGRKAFVEGAALVIDPCYSVHTMFMRFPIVFLDKEDRVIKIAPGLRPYRASIARGAQRVVELPAGAAQRCGLSVGDCLAVESG